MSITINKENNKVLLSILIEEIKTNLNFILSNKLKKIFLYGSYARKENNFDSDIDFIALTDLNKSELMMFDDAIIDLIVDLSLKYEINVSIQLKNESDFYNFKNILPFYNNIATEGITIYG